MRVALCGFCLGFDVKVQTQLRLEHIVLVDLYTLLAHGALAHNTLRREPTGVASIVATCFVNLKALT